MTFTKNSSLGNNWSFMIIADLQRNYGKSLQVRYLKQTSVLQLSFQRLIYIQYLPNIWVRNLKKKCFGLFPVGIYVIIHCFWFINSSSFKIEKFNYLTAKGNFIHQNTLKKVEVNPFEMDLLSFFLLFKV